MVVLRCILLLFGFLSKGHIPKVSCQSRMSNKKGNYAVQLAAVHEYPDIYPLAVEKLLKFQPGDCTTSHCLKWAPLPPNDGVLDNSYDSSNHLYQLLLDEI